MKQAQIYGVVKTESSEGFVKNGLREGTWLEIKNKMVVNKYKYNQGVLDGQQLDYYSTGQIKVVYHNKNGCLDGSYKEFSIMQKIEK